MINKRQFKIRDTKKVMHKIGKHWAVISTLMLGILAGGTTVANVNAKAADTTDNDDQANHQLSNQSVKSAGSTLVSNGGISANSSSVQNHVQAASGANSSVSTSSVASTSVSSASLGSNYDMKSSNDDDNVLNRADQIHNNVLSEVARGNDNDNQASQPKASHLLGGQDTQDINSDLLSSLLKPDTLLSLANANQGNQAYGSLMNTIGGMASLNFNNNGNSTSFGTVYNSLNAINTDLQNLNGKDSNLNNITTSLTDILDIVPIASMYESDKNNVNLYSKPVIEGTDPNSAGTIAHYVSKVNTYMTLSSSESSGIVSLVNDMAMIQKNHTAIASYSHAFSTLASLPSDNSAKQASALDAVAQNIKGTVTDAGLPNSDAFTTPLENFATEASQKATSIDDADAVNSVLSDVDASTLFSTATDVLANSNFAKHSTFANLMSSAKNDLATNTNASNFIQSFGTALDTFGGATANAIKNSLNNLYTTHSAEVSAAYGVASSNASESNGVNSLLDDIASLSANNSTTELNNIHDAITSNPVFSGISSLNDIANSASTEATSVSESNAYKGLLNKESTLLSGVVNRINANGFNSNAFNTLVSNAENDLARASNASDFINSLASQDSAFNGTTAQKIKNDLTNFVNNPEFSNAYRAVHNSSAATDSILNDLSGMNSDNEVAKLSDIANVAKTDFSNSASFGSLATDATNMKASVINSQAASQQAASASVSTAINSLVSDFPVSATLSFVASKFASSGFNDASRFTTLMNNAKADFDGADANNVNSFLDNLATQADQDFSAGDDQFINNAFNSMKSNSAISDAYSLLQNNKSAADDIFNDAATMTTQNASSELNSIADTISLTPAFNNISAISNAANSARSAANSASTSASNRIASTSTANTDAASAEFSRLTSSEVIAPLFSAGIDRIVASGFNSGAFKTLISNVEDDLSNASNDSSFVNDFVNQDSAFSGQTHRTVNSVMNQLANNPEMSSAYTAIRSNRGNVDQILNSLSGMNSSNEAATLSNVAQLAGNHTFNSVAFMGSLANDADVAATSVSNSQSISNQNVANQEAYSASSDASKAAGSAEQASTNATQLINSNRNLASGYPSNSFSTAASNEIQDASTEAGSVSTDAANASSDAFSASYYSALAAGQHPSTVKHGFGAEAPETNLQYAQQAQQADGDAQQANQDAQNALVKVKGDVTAAQHDADQAQNTPDVSIIAGLIQPVFNAITKPGFKSQQFSDAIQNVENYLNTATSLSQLWNDVKGNPNVAAFTSRHGNTTNQVISDVTSNKGLQNAYQQVHSDSNLKTILNNLVTIANNHDDANGKSANQTNHRNIKDAVNTIVSTINKDSKLNTIDGMTGNDGITGQVSSISLPSVEPSSSNSQATKADVQLIADMMPTIVNAITKPGFRASQFDGAIQAVESHLNDSRLSQLWNDVKGDSNVTAFTNRHGNLTDKITNLLNGNGSEVKELDQAYQDAHSDNNVKNILNDLQKIANNHLDNNGKSASHQTNVNVQNALKHIASVINGDNTLKNIQGMHNVAQNASNEASYNPAVETPAKHQTATASVQLIAGLESSVLNTLTRPSFDRSAFDQVISAIKGNLNNTDSLSDLWNAVKYTDGVQAFTNRHGNLTDKITDILTSGNNDMDDLNAAYSQVHKDNNLSRILTDLQTISDHASNKANVSLALNDIANAIKNDGNLNSIDGMLTIERNSSGQASAYQSHPHYAKNDTEFNNVLSHLVNDYTVKALADHLASKQFADSGERKAFNDIISKLQSLPSELLSRSNVNNTLDKISSDLNSFNGPVSKGMSDKVENLINDVKANDSTPNALATYADSLGNNAEGDLINDLNQGMQDVKNGQNNTDYKTALSDLMNIDANVTTEHDPIDARATQEDRNLKAIANTINKGGLKNIPLLKDVAYEAHHVANLESHARKQAPIHTTDKNNHINHVNHVVHVKKQRANAQHWSNVARRDRMSANHAVVAATVDAQKAERSAAAAQSFTSGLNSCSDSTSARNAARAASTDAAHASSEAAQASTDAHKAMTDSVADNDSTIISDTNDARSIADRATKDANSAASEFKVAKTTAKKAGLAPHYADQTFNDALGHLINGYTMQKLVDHLTSNNFAKSGERKAFNDVLTQLQNLPSQLSSQKNVNGTLDKISSDLNGFHGPISKGMAKKVQKLITDVEQHDDTPSTLVTYANADGADGKLINDFNAGVHTVKDGKDNQDYKSILSDLIDLDTHPANQDHDLGEIAKTINHNHDLKIISLLKNVSRTAHQMARSANHAKQYTDGKRHAKMINDENQHRRDVVRHALINANHAASNAASIAARAVKSADAVQANASGLNPGSDSTLASSYATNASADADQMKDVASQASSLAHVARANDRGSANVVLNDTKAVDDLSSLVSDNANIVTTDAQDASKAAQRAGKAPQPNVEVIANVVPQILQRITAKGFDSSDFDKAVEAAKSDLSAKTLTDFLSNFNKNASVKRFLGGNGTVTQAITKLLNRNGSLQSAYYDYHNDVNLPQILSDLEAIAAHQQIGDNLVAKDGDRTAVKNDLTDISRLVNDGHLNKIAGANDVLTAINSFNAHYKPSTKSTAKPSNVKPSLPINADFVNDVLERLTDPQFNKQAFIDAIDNKTNGIEHALSTNKTLSGFLTTIQSNNSVKAFTHNNGSLTQKIMSILKHSPKYNAAYGVAHDEVTTVNAVLSDLSDIAGQRLDNNGKNDQIDTDLDNIANVITKDSKLMKVGGMSTVAKVARDDSNNYQVVPHYADQNFNQTLSDLVNNYTVQQLADHLASKSFAQSDEKEAFNQIIHDLAILPNNSDVNSDLSNISSELKNFRGPLSGKMATKVQGLIKQVEAHDSTPDDLAAYADSLNNSDGNLINDLNKGLQDVKNQPNNYDYQTVLGDLIDISQNPKREDHDLNDIAKVINKGNLSKIPLLANVASVAHEVAKSENSTRRHQNRPQQKKDAASQAAAKQKRAKDFAKRSAAKSAQSSAAKQHAASRKANSLAHAKHMKARSAATSAKSAHARARSVKAAAQSASVKSADSSAVSEASAAASNAFIADSSAKLAVESSNTKVSNVNSAASNVEKMYDQNKGDSSLSEDAEEASNYADKFSNDAKAASLDENKTNSADMLANSDYKATSSAANANEPSLAASYANDGSQEASQASQYASSTANEMNAASQASDGIASLAHDAALQSSADVKMSSANASASSAIKSAKSSKASSAKSGSKSSSKASSNNDSSAIASANSRANSASSASAKAAASYASLVNSYSSAIKSARTANDQSRANSLASASTSASQSYSAAAESASASVSAATSAANAAQASASSAESASANAERASESAHEAAVTSGIRASIASASQSAAAAENAASVSASRSANAEEAAREHSNSGAANSAESAIQSMTAKISSYADAMKSAEANRSGSNNDSSSNSDTNGNDDASASASASQSAAAAESAASVSASQSASLSASEAIASQSASASAASGNTNFTPNSGSSSFNWNPTPNNSVTPSSYNSTPSSVASQSFSSRASASQSAQPTTERVSFVNTDNPLALAVGQALKSGNAIVSRVPAHYRWFEVKRTCLAHNHIGSVGQINDYSKVLHAGYLARVDRVFKVTEDGHTVYRYELNVHGHHYYVTGNSLFTHESYYQANDLTAHHVNHRDGQRYYQAVVRTPCLDYNSPQYSADRVVRNLYRGDMVRIKRLIKIGRPGDYMTRFELIDGTFVTANKYFLKLI